MEFFVLLTTETPLKVTFSKFTPKDKHDTCSCLSKIPSLSSSISITSKIPSVSESETFCFTAKPSTVLLGNTCAISQVAVTPVPTFVMAV